MKTGVHIIYNPWRYPSRTRIAAADVQVDMGRDQISFIDFKVRI